MKTIIFSFSVFAVLACGALNAAPVVSDVKMSQNPGTCLVTVTYKLSGDPGVITLDIQTNCTDGAETKWVKKADTGSVTVKKLKAKKKYYVRIRAYKTADGKKIYSPWSVSKTVKTK